MPCQAVTSMKIPLQPFLIRLRIFAISGTKNVEYFQIPNLAVATPGQSSSVSIYSFGAWDGVCHDSEGQKILSKCVKCEGNEHSQMQERERQQPGNGELKLFLHHKRSVSVRKSDINDLLLSYFKNK
jgi:hypothetical protein